MKLRRTFLIYAIISGCLLLLYVGIRAVTAQFQTEIPRITLFTSWSTYPEAYVVYNNTFRNWPSLKPHVNIILYTNDNLPDGTEQLGWKVLPVPRQIKGYPVLKDLFIETMKLQPNSKLFGFVNGDILFTKSVISTLQGIISSPLLFNKRYLVIGRRMNTPNVTREVANSWESIENVAKRGELMNERWGIDYFFTPPGYHWNDIPDVQIGLRFYDNWLVWDARRKGYEVVDATNTLLAVHQNPLYPKKHGERVNNINYFKESRNTLYNMGVVACANLQTVYFNRTIALQRRKEIPKYCTM